MIREVRLVPYLPPPIAEFKEISTTLEAEEPEFALVWKAADQVLQNEFIETADEYGLSRFEKMLGVLPSIEDTLESRRARVRARWFAALPFTVKSLAAKLASICGENGFSIVKGFGSYQITIKTGLKLFGEVEEVERLLDAMVPCNMVVNTYNEILPTVGCGAYVGVAVGQHASFAINTEP